MKHQFGRKKLNVTPSHRRSLLRNQVIQLITNGHLTTTTARAKETRRLAEKLVTVAREGNTFTAHRRAKMLLPYKSEALSKLFNEIAPRYTNRPGGFTRLIPLGRRKSDTASVAKLEWV